MRRRFAFAIASIAGLAPACDAHPPPDPGPRAVARFESSDGGAVPPFLDVPFPSDVYLEADGTVVNSLPGLETYIPSNAHTLQAALGKLNGFGLTSGALFRIDHVFERDDTGEPAAARIDASSLPAAGADCQVDGAAVLLVDLEASSGEEARLPCRAAYQDDRPNQESHHFPRVHPGLEARTPWARSSSHEFGGRWLGGTMELPDGWETVSASGARRGRPFVAGEEDRRLVRDAHLFPGWLTSLQPDYFLSYRLLPRAPALTTVVAEIYLHVGAPPAAHDDVFTFWDRTNQEDREICERQHRGVTSPGYEPGRYAPVEDGVHAFDRRVARAYLDALEHA